MYKTTADYMYLHLQKVVNPYIEYRLFLYNSRIIWQIAKDPLSTFIFMMTMPLQSSLFWGACH